MGNGVPLYEAAKRKILKRLETREWLPGAKLPPEGELSRELGVSVGTLRHAVGELCDEGILWRRALAPMSGPIGTEARASGTVFSLSRPGMGCR
jgi:DNA-binding FadR family transcriptional regulator